MTGSSDARSCSLAELSTSRVAVRSPKTSLRHCRSSQYASGDASASRASSALRTATRNNDETSSAVPGGTAGAGGAIGAIGAVLATDGNRKSAAPPAVNAPAKGSASKPRKVWARI